MKKAPAACCESISDSLKTKIAQMLMIDFSGFQPGKETLSHLTSIPWGGFILFAKNVKSRGRLIELNKQLMVLYREKGFPPPFISVDQEGGIVNRLEFPDVHLSPGSMPIGKANDTNLAEKMAFISGAELREMGFHLNFAPVADVNNNPQNPIIGVRSFGEDPETVSKMVAAQIRGYEKAGIGCCAKHFPGHGDTSLDSHLALPTVVADGDRLRSVEFPPFVEAINQGVPAVMTAHVVFRALDNKENIPATLSKQILTGILREKMNFQGMAITDSMSMKGITLHYGVEEGAIKAVNAGADVVMMCGTADSQIRAYRALCEAAADGRIPKERIDEAVRRINDFKQKYVVNTKPIPQIPNVEKNAVVDEIARRSVTKLYDNGALPFNVEDKTVLVLTPQHLIKTELYEYSLSKSTADYLKGLNCNVRQVFYDPASCFSENTVSALEGEKPGVAVLELFTLGMLKEHAYNEAQRITKAASAVGVPVFLVALSGHYGFPESAVAAITAFSCHPSSIESLTKRFFSC